jgi:hypothetical protein
MFFTALSFCCMVSLVMVDDYDGDVVIVAVAEFVAGLCYL